MRPAVAARATRMTNRPIFTIGHSNHSLEDFLALLAGHGVAVVADVRSAPYSRFNPQFNRDAFVAALKARGIDYLYLGRALGGRPDDPACYEGGRVRYEIVARTSGFREGIARVVDEAATGRIALMCAEKEPLDCHRTLLVARALDDEGMAVAHILATGDLDLHAKAMDRLMARFDLDPAGDLFRSREEAVAQAIACQAGRIAFVRKGPGEEPAALPAAGHSPNVAR